MAINALDFFGNLTIKPIFCIEINDGHRHKQKKSCRPAVGGNLFYRVTIFSNYFWVMITARLGGRLGN